MVVVAMVRMGGDWEPLCGMRLKKKERKKERKKE